MNKTLKNKHLNLQSLKHLTPQKKTEGWVDLCFDISLKTSRVLLTYLYGQILPLASQ